MGDPEVHAALRNAFHTHGFCWVTLPESLRGMSANLATAATEFFELPAEARLNARGPPTTGYVSVAGFKEGFRAFTGELSVQAHWVPEKLRGTINPLASTLDGYFRRLLPLISETVFQVPIDSIVSDDRVALFRKENPCAMLDLAMYYQSSEEQPNATVVSGHADPGLLTLHLLSSAEGLELFDQSTQAWVRPPEGSGVLWCGAAASELTDGYFKAGLHRVCRASPRRTALWYELCTTDQVPLELTNQQRASPALPTIPTPIGLRFSLSCRTLTGKTFSIPSITSTTTILDVMHTIEEKEGIPPPKQRLVFKGRQLAADCTVADYGMQPGDVLHLVLSL
eukprot:TRINITY_DN72530_c0_g1_i1.p1 TRINITY_DN72530_c0_g1~~TRINITY_DN72530_c0_g1_i1.p1  ORF type:complete len:357 (+),score=48.81 TRINITY_DN72530_c0_g1_i1:57-1073(+)